MKELSIIICSRTGKLESELEENLYETAGCEFELIVIDNSSNQYSIFQAYNEGIHKSTTPFLVFLHDDIHFHTNGWGPILINLLEKNLELALIGVAGSRIRTKVPAAWWENAEEHLVVNIIQNRPESDDRKLRNTGFKNNRLEEVKMIDGVFMGLRKMEGIGFDEEAIGFHNYDFNLCMEVLKKGLNIAVTNEILVEHFSSGSIDATWIKTAHQFNKKYKKLLPQTVKGSIISKSDLHLNYYRFIENCRYMGCRKIGFKYWLKYLLHFPNSNQNKEWLDFFRKDIF